MSTETKQTFSIPTESNEPTFLLELTPAQLEIILTGLVIADNLRVDDQKVYGQPKSGTNYMALRLMDIQAMLNQQKKNQEAA